MQNLTRDEQEKFNKYIYEFGYENALKYQKKPSSIYYFIERFFKSNKSIMFLIAIFPFLGIYLTSVFVFGELKNNVTQTYHEFRYVTYSIIVFLILILINFYINKLLDHYNKWRVMICKNELNKRDIEIYELIEFKDSRNDIRCKIRKKFKNISKDEAKKTCEFWIECLHDIEHSNSNNKISLFISNIINFIGGNSSKINNSTIKLIKYLLSFGGISIFVHYKLYNILKVYQGSLYILYVIIAIYFYIVIYVKKKNAILALCDEYVEQLQNYIKD